MAEEMNVFKMCQDGLKNFSDFMGVSGFGIKPFSMDDAIKHTSRSMTSGLEIYNAWIKGVKELSDKCFMLCKQAANGEKADAECLLDTASEMCGNLTDQMMEAIKDTAFQGMAPILKSIKDSLEFKSNGQIMKSLLQPSIDMSVSMVGMMKSAYGGVMDMMNFQKRSQMEA